MAIINQFLSIFKAFLGSLAFVVKHKLYVYFIPAIVFAILFYYSMKGGANMSSRMAFMEDWWVIGSIVRGMESGLKSLSFVLFEFVILILLTPINSYFAEKVKEDITGVKVDFGFGQFIKSIFRSIKIFAIAFSIEIFLLILLWILSFLFGDAFYKIVAFMVTSFFIGFSFFDFALELDAKNAKTSWQFGTQHKWICLFAGLIFSVAIYIPEETGFLVLFLFTITLVPHMLTIAAAQVYFKEFGQKNTPTLS
ncbi:hypothetical protein DNU06_01275 [Putridiphycobacter roseus]|uniref:EI24 domain-containing protein n=1 Tax=Putridiphycobacter roseus TaxID=2219161 RepID=A0A2W1NHB6_9FLAO|nr:EI24 domain-containing protein [Putridiphycobacter roseus]PZE18493.1 hypothetical protein DNU06_01275 [Putridiphycobacter roseus]